MAEIDRRGISTADDDADPFIWLRPIGAGKQRCKGGRATWLGDDAQHVPKGGLRVSDCVVGDQYDMIDMAPGDRKNPLVDSARLQ